MLQDGLVLLLLNALQDGCVDYAEFRQFVCLLPGEPQPAVAAASIVAPSPNAAWRAAGGWEAAANNCQPRSRSVQPYQLIAMRWLVLHKGVSCLHSGILSMQKFRSA